MTASQPADNPARPKVPLTFLPALAIAGLVLLINLPDSPLYRVVPSRDSGVFLYIGKQLLVGELPYVSIWDHKGPLLYVLNAIGFVITNNSYWGVWLLQYLCLVISFCICYRIIRRATNRQIATIVTIATLSGLLYVLEGGNYTESYALLFQFLALFIGLSQPASRWNLLGSWILLGILLGAVFFLRQNLIGVWITLIFAGAIDAYIARSWRKYLLKLLSLALGAMLLSATIIFTLMSKDIIPAFIDAAFRYNALYTQQTSNLERLLSPLIGIRNTAPVSFLPFALAAWVLVYERTRKRVHQRHREIFLHHYIVLIVAIGLPLEIALSSISGNSFPHYFMSWLPITSLTAGIVLGSLRQQRLVLSLVAVILIPLLIPAIILLHLPLITGLPTQDPVTTYITENTRQDDYVLMWGAETAYNFLADRRSPTRFVYQYPLYLRGYQSDDLVRELLFDIRYKCPTLIIDTSSSNSLIPPLAPELRATWTPELPRKYALLPSMQEVFDYVERVYRPLDTIEAMHWPVYTPLIPNCGNQNRLRFSHHYTRADG